VPSPFYVWLLPAADEHELIILRSLRFQIPGLRHVLLLLLLLLLLLTKVIL
jgi:hypothetical protein